MPSPGIRVTLWDVFCLCVVELSIVWHSFCGVGDGLSSLGNGCAH
jgi:hypothetical protein